MSIISDADVDSYHDNGYLVVPGLVNPEGVEVLRRDATRVCRGEYPHEALRPSDPGESDDDVLARYLCIHQPHKISPVLLETGVKHAGMAAVLDRLIGPDAKCMQSMLFIKPPGFQGQGWHQDEIYIPTRDRSLTGGWIALDDATEENGCLRVIKGSHKIRKLRKHNTVNDNKYTLHQVLDQSEYDENDAVDLELKRGQISLHDVYLLHGSKENLSSNSRRGMTLRFMPTSSVFDREVANELTEQLGGVNHSERSLYLMRGKDESKLNDFRIRQ